MNTKKLALFLAGIVAGATATVILLTPKPDPDRIPGQKPTDKHT